MGSRKKLSSAGKAQPASAYPQFARRTGRLFDSAKLATPTAGEKSVGARSQPRHTVRVGRSGHVRQEGPVRGKTIGVSTPASQCARTSSPGTPRHRHPLEPVSVRGQIMTDSSSRISMARGRRRDLSLRLRLPIQTGQPVHALPILLLPVHPQSFRSFAPRPGTQLRTLPLVSHERNPESA